ncbi:ladinin-1-like isoform X2 [Acipenser ruthenus]|uniref:ladinin-1-like isoform X2 n=1 Tax=Acipenser ruthenus TaxID=7906 RepID=UPI002741B409|nr:ladinin-1-like isoform X2 [Acipenser ruthenus]
MSISRKNWSALSSLTRQWTVEDEEEVERERRRRIRSTSTTSEPPDSSSNEPGEQKPHSAQDKEKPEEADPENLAFLEMLKTRDERRKKRHLETLMRQKEGVEECQPSTPEPEREGQGGRVEAEGEGQRGRIVIESKAQREGQGGRLDTEAQKDSMGGVQRELRNSTGRGKFRIEGAGTETATNQEPVTTPTKSPPGKFVSSLSISLDKSQEFPAETKNLSSPTSPASPTTPVGTRPTPRERRVRTEGAAVEDVQMRHPPSRATSFRVTSRSEDPPSRFNRSSSLRIPSRTKEEKMKRLSKQETTLDGESTPPFQRNSKLRISSRTIEEKLERLAMAAQKSEQVKSPTASRKDCFLFADEVARKRGVFEREATSVERNSATSRKDNLDFSAGISERINRWISKTQRSEKSPGPTDLRKVDLSSKRNLWENRSESSSASPSKR